jgi:AcrR family transcriptional regulator
MPKISAASRIKPRKSPLQARSANTVEAILEAAARILESQGLVACTTNAVAQRAGVSIGSLYQYFPNRDALTAALIERETVQLMTDIERAAQQETAAGRLHEMVRAAVAHQMRRPELARVIDFEEQRLPLQERKRSIGERLHKAVTAALRLPDAPPLPDIALAAYDVLAIVHGMVDAAGARAETDATALEQRVMLAVGGYLKAVSAASVMPAGRKTKAKANIETKPKTKTKVKTTP